MSLHDAIYAAYSVPVLGAGHGVSLTYREPGGAPVALDGVAGPDAVEVSQDQDGTKRKHKRRLTLFGTAEELPPAIPLRSIVTISGWDYAIECEAERTDAYVVLDLLRIDRVEVSRHGYRR